MEGKPVINAKGLEVGYGRGPILPPVDFQIHPGELWGLVGINGSGKTTMLRTLLGLMSPIAGVVEKASGATIAYVPQRGVNDVSAPGRVFDMVRSGMDHSWSFLNPLLGRSGRRRIRDALDVVGMAGHASSPFAELSEGQKQRVLVAGALVSNPDLLVLDEPTSAMDHEGEHAVFHLLEQIAETGTAILVVTHHLTLILEHATHLAFVDRECRTAVFGTVPVVIGDGCFLDHFGTFPGTPVSPVRHCEGCHG